MIIMLNLPYSLFFTAVPLLPCDSIFRTLRPELFTHCLCNYTMWGKWSRTGFISPDNGCPSGYKYKQARNRTVITGNQTECTNTTDEISICE